MTANKDSKHLSYNTRQEVKYINRPVCLHSNVLAFQLPSKLSQTGWAYNKRQKKRLNSTSQSKTCGQSTWRGNTNLRSGLISARSFSFRPPARRTGRGPLTAPPPRQSWASPLGSENQIQSEHNENIIPQSQTTRKCFKFKVPVLRHKLFGVTGLFLIQMTVKAMYLCYSSHGLCHLITHKDMKHGQVKKVLQEVGDGRQTYQFHFINIRCHCFFFGHFSKRIPGIPITINT